MTYNMKTLFAAGCLALSMGQTVEAQTLGAISIEMDGWAYEPILNGGNIEAMVAVRIASSASKVDALWLEPTPDGAWTAQAWNNVVPEEVAAYVFDHVGASTIDSSLDDIMGMWPIDLDQTMLSDFILAPLAPTPFGDGVFVGDALQAAIYANPGLLQPLETIGYPAVATLSGSTVSGGTFTGGGAIGPPSPAPGECIAVFDLLNTLQISFESSTTDINLVHQVFQAEYAMNSTCNSCPVDTIVLNDTGWVFTCGSWNLISVHPNAADTECIYKWDRSVSGTRTRTRLHVFEDCTNVQCTQTKTRSGTQHGNTITFHSPGSVPVCPENGPTPTLDCDCDYFFGFRTCIPSSWSPASCPW